jgi:hypothetical protein
MVTAVIQNGLIVPRDPLPAEWTEGTEVEVDKSIHSSQLDDEIDLWLAEMDAIAANGDPADDRRLEAALEQHRREQKALARKNAGLAE